MKKLLILLASVSLTATTITPVTAILTAKNQDDDYIANSFNNLVKMLNTKYTSKEILDKSREIDAIIDGLVPEYYDNGFNGQIPGVLRSWTTEPTDEETILWTFNDTFRNDSSLEQTYNTESYTKSIANTHTFSVSLSEKISASASIKNKFSVPFIETEVGFEMSLEIGSTQEWTDSTTETVTITAPSQTIKTSPHSVLDVMYVIKQGVYNSKGIINFEIEDKNEQIFKIPRFYFSEDGEFINTTWKMWSISEMIETLMEVGYADQLKNSTREYSILTVDNIDQTNNKVYLNLPITWKSQGGQIEVSHKETPIIA